MQTRELTYIDGEDWKSLEVFEGLFQKVLEQYKPKKRIALILPCSHGKPYSCSYIIGTIFLQMYQSLPTTFDQCRDQAFRAHTRKIVNPLNLFDIWHMSSAGFIPSEYENIDDGVVSFNAYNWDSARATDEDIQAWYKMTELRLIKWCERYGNEYDRVVLYFRPRSKSLNLWLNLAPLYLSENKIIPVLRDAPNQERDVDRLAKAIGTYDPDYELVTVYNLTALNLALYSAYYEVWKEGKDGLSLTTTKED